MNRLVLIGLVPLALAGPALAQTMDHSTMPGMTMPAAPAKPAAKPAMTPTKPAPGPADPHAGHDMPADAPMDHSAMPGMDMNTAAQASTTIGDLEVPTAPPPTPPSDHAADRVFSPAVMAAARGQLRREHGGASNSMVMANIAEWSPRSGKDSYRWEGEAWFGDDIHRLVLKSEGEGVSGDGVDHAELQALYSRAIGPYFNLQAGVRRDFEPRPSRTYATVGFEGLAPYWFEVSGAAFLSNKGDLSGRLEGSYDQRLTQRLILQPRAEFNLAASNDMATGVGSGLSDAELGLRLRYEIRREFAPYVGVTYDRKFGGTADHARAAGQGVEDTRLVLGLRAWF
ncbi:MAG: copper resistance protein CopB [Caulobacter sp.]|nr:copper resistance protein CopB [Caulobacter sp.]